MIPYSKQNITKEDEDVLRKALFHPFLTQGPKIGEFEKSLSQKHKCADAVACSSGSAALHLAYAGCGIDEDGIGIVPAITFASTANGFKHLGARVLFCDVDPTTGIIDLNSLETTLKKANSERVSGQGVIAPVSFAGQVAPLRQCYELAKEFDFKIVEDASHSPLAIGQDADEGVRSCSCEWTDYATLSFHPVKHLCSGEGGAVLCKTKDHAVQPRKLRSHGIIRDVDPEGNQPWKYYQTDLGWNYRLTDLQAALGLSQLKRLEREIEKRKGLASIYNQELKAEPFSDIFELPSFHSGHVWHLYVLRFKRSEWRDNAYHFLKKKGILTQVHYIPVYHHPYFGGLSGNEKLPGAEQFFSSCLSIPLFPTMTGTDQNQVIDNLQEYCNSLIF